MPTQDNGFGDYWTSAFGPGAIAPGPVVQAPTAAYTARGGNQANAYDAGIGLSPEEQGFQSLLNGYNNQQSTIAQNRQQLDLIGRLGQNTTNMDQEAQNGILGQIGWQDGQNANYLNQGQDLVNQLGGITNTANAFDWNNLGTYQQQIQAINGDNDSIMKGYTDQYNQLINPISSGVSWAGDLTSQAAQAYADPQAVAAQAAAQAQLAAIGSGSLDVSLGSNQGYQNLLGWSNGDHDVDPMSIVGMNQLQGVANGSLDLHPGDIDPEAYAALKDARGKYKDLTTPEVTDAERFIYEQSLQNQIQNDRANRQGVNSQLRQRGLSGAGQQIASSALASQTNSENALLTSLGANANAVQRAMTALGGYADVSGQMNQQANALGVQNQNTRSGALNNLTNIGAQIENANANRQLSATGQAADLYESNAQNNNNRRLAGTQSSAQVAGQMRDSSFNEAYARGQAADSTAQFNRVQSLGVDEFNATFAENDASRRGELAGQYARDSVGANQIKAANDFSMFDQGRTTNQTTFGRASGVLGAQDTQNGRVQSLAQKQTDARIAAANGQIGLNDRAFGRDSNQIGAGMGLNQQSADAYTGLQQGMGGLALSGGQAAAAKAQAQDGNGGGPDWGEGAKDLAVGAGAGAAIGSIVPGVGTAIGAGIGGIGYGLYGLFKGG